MIETNRLTLRKLTQDDFSALCEIMLDDATMYAYEGAFTEAEVQGWLDRQLKRYADYGYGLFAVVLKETGKVIGQCGLTIQGWNGRELLEVGYLFNRAYWHHGYAVEAARACRDYAFNVLGAEEVYSIIRDTNRASQNVAKRNSMHIVDRWVKHFRGVDMPHILFCVKNPAAAKALEISLWEALKQRDRAAFAGLVASDAVMVCGGLRLSGSDYADSVSDFDCAEYYMSDFEVVYEDAGLIQNHYIIRTTIKDPINADLAGDFHVTSTWKLCDGSWQLIYNMDSRLPERE